jgi:hypothetical protein
MVEARPSLCLDGEGQFRAAIAMLPSQRGGIM